MMKLIIKLYEKINNAFKNTDGGIEAATNIIDEYTGAAVFEKISVMFFLIIE